MHSFWLWSQGERDGQIGWPGGKRCGDLPGDRETGDCANLVTDQTSAHDALMDMFPQACRSMRLWSSEKGPEALCAAIHESMAIHVKAMLELQKKGSVVSTTGTIFGHRRFKRASKTPSTIQDSSLLMFGLSSAKGKALSDGLPFPETQRTSPRPMSRAEGISK